MNDINKKLGELLSGANADKIKQFTHSEELKKLADSLSGEEKNRLLEEFLKTDTNLLRQRLSSADLNSLGKIDAEKLIKLLRG